MTMSKEIKFIKFNGKPFINSMQLDINFRNKLNYLLAQYRGSNENYIRLVYNNVTLNTINIFNVDDNFILDDIDIILVIICNKKHIYCQEYNNTYKLNDKYDDKYHDLLKILVNKVNYNYIINSSYNNIVLAAVTAYGCALQYASDDMKNNYDIVLEAVKQNGRALQHASDNIKNNYDIVLAALNQDAYALQHASVDMKNNSDIVLAAVKKINMHYNIQVKI